MGGWVAGCGCVCVGVCVYMFYILFMHSSINETHDCSHTLIIVSDTVVRIQYVFSLFPMLDSHCLKGLA